jgi:hypothetical protein
MLLPFLMAIAASEPVTSPVWISRPNGEQIAQVYPRKALEEQLSGNVVFNCTWNEDGRPINCVVESETPTGAGFLEAGLALSKGFHARSTLEDGSPITGRPYRLPIRFVPPTTEVGAIKIVTPTGGIGKVTLNCRTDSDARLDNCFIHGETDHGLGQAALNLIDEANALRPESTRERQSYARIRLPIIFVAP